MIPKGSMLKVKRIIGYALLAVGILLLLYFDSTMEYIHQYKTIFSIVLVGAGFFLSRSGTQL